MAVGTNDALEQLDRHLASANQAWLFGAGISCAAGIPLMYPLTSRVLALVPLAPYKALLDALRGELPTECHIEHILSHLGDYNALAKRSKRTDIRIGGLTTSTEDLVGVHKAILKGITETVRWGYHPPADGSDEQIGTPTAPLVTVDSHKKFVQALFNKARAGLNDRKNSIRLFSLNYDTLLEDALALSAIPYWDGFSGGAVAFRNHQFGAALPDQVSAYVIKLHGSIDWWFFQGKVWRVRDFDVYPDRTGHVMIYPQATKYVATQRDPFAAQFDIFRQTLANREDNILAVCGYSFGDEHLNQDIEYAMSAPNNKTTMIVFLKEGAALPQCLVDWRTARWCNRLYIVTQKGVYVGNDGPNHLPKPGTEHDWWTFEGVIKVLSDGAEGYIK